MPRGHRAPSAREEGKGCPARRQGSTAKWKGGAHARPLIVVGGMGEDARRGGGRRAGPGSIPPVAIPGRVGRQRRQAAARDGARFMVTVFGRKRTQEAADEGRRTVTPPTTRRWRKKSLGRRGHRSAPPAEGAGEMAKNHILPAPPRAEARQRKRGSRAGRGSRGEDVGGNTAPRKRPFCGAAIAGRVVGRKSSRTRGSRGGLASIPRREPRQFTLR